MFTDFVSSTTNEPGPLTPDLDQDDAGAILYCLSPPVGGICPGAMAVAVGVARTAPYTFRRLNVVADMNDDVRALGHGRWNVVTERFATSGRHDNEGIASVQTGQDRLFLQRA